jgi:hypothetical protein
MSSMTKTAMVVLSICLSGVTTVGCGAGAVSVVRRGSYSGELALRGAVVDSHYAAEEAILDHCQGRARIVSGTEGAELAVRDADRDRAKPRADVAPEVERVHYVCVSLAPAVD